MAYNPFNIFRRNQKAIFAVVTVFIMFTFVLSSGLGGGADFFDWLPRWLGQKSKKGDVVCSIDGGKVYSSELEQLRFNRVMANRFMNQAALFTRAGLENEVEELTPRVSPETKSVLDSIRQREGFLHLMGPEAQSMVQQMYFTLQRGVINSPIAKAEDKRAAGMKQLSLSLLQSLLAGGSENHYFSNMPNRTNRDLVNFLLWQKKADQLGISITTDDVKRLIDKEFHGIFRGQLEVEVRKNLQRDMANFNLNRCIEAIGEEFRVRMAQVAVLGPVAHGSRADMTYGGFPMFGTSYEAFDFYRDQCSPTAYGVIPVPAINFLPLVPEPDESNPQTRAELIDLYDKYKNDEPNLGREAPGLKEPRKIKIEWLAVTGSEPYFVKLAEEQLQQGELQAKVGSMLTVPLLGASPMFMAAATAPIAVKEPLVLAAYDSVIREHQFSLSDRYDTANFSLARLMPSSIVRPGVLVGAAGHAAGQALAFGHPLATIAKTAAAPFAYEVRDRVKTGVPAVLLALGSIPSVKTEVLGLSIGQPVPGPLPGPALFANLMGAHVAYEMMLPKPLPIDAVKPELMKNLTATTAKNIAFGEPVNPARPAPPGPPKKGDLQTFIDEVNKLSDNGKVRPSDKDKFAALQKYITEFAAKRGLTITGNKTPLSEWKLEEDPNLATLVTAQKESLKRSPHQQQAEYIPFANSFFWDQGDRRRPTTGVYKADFYPEQRQQFRDPTRDETKPQYLTWRTEEVAAKVPSSFDEAKPAVKAVWKHQKARELAKARAEKLAETIRAGTASSEATVLGPLLDQSNVLAAEFAKDPVARDRIMPFLVEGVCPLTTVSNPTANKGLIPSFASSLPSQMHDFRLPPSENVKYPSRDMGLKLLDERTKPVKTVLVLTDEPKDIYYVTTLMKREEKQSWEFQNLLRQGAGGNQNVVLGNYIGQGRDKTIASVMGLLKKEFKYEETEEQKKKLDERRSGE